MVAERIQLLSEVLQYPDVLSWESAVEQGIQIRSRMDKYQWRIGWLARAVREKYKDQSPNILSDFADAVGYSVKTLYKWHWVAGIFTPDDVNQFPGMAFSFFEVAARLAEDDKETAMQMLQNAYDEPTITIRQFEGLIHADENLPIIPAPFRAIGRAVSMKHGKGVIIGVYIETLPDEWDAQFKESPIYNHQSEVRFTIPTRSSSGVRSTE